MTTFRLRQILLRSTNVEQALSNQTELANLEVSFRDQDRYIAFERTPLNVAIVGPSEARYPLTLAYRVDDVDDAVQILTQRGFTVVEPPSQGAHESHALLLDPDGVPTSVYCPKAQE